MSWWRSTTSSTAEAHDEAHETLQSVADTLQVQGPQHSLGPPLNHSGLWVDDLQATVVWLKAQGMRFAPGGIRKGASGFDICFIHPKASDEFPIGGEGVLIELRAPDPFDLGVGAIDGGAGDDVAAVQVQRDGEMRVGVFDACQSLADADIDAEFFSNFTA